jgi:hypothetical protein
MTRLKTLRLLKQYLDLYYSIGEEDKGGLLAIGDIHNERFLAEFVPYLENLLTISKGRWQLTGDDTGTIVKAGDMAKRIASQIIDLISTWIIENFPLYYKQGLELWNINLQMLDELPVKVKLTEDDTSYIANVEQSEISAWLEHLNRHARQIERYVGDGLGRGWTMERFVEACTCPDGFIVDFLEGNARISWHEHLRRFGEGRGKIIAQTALERRGNVT